MYAAYKSSVLNKKNNKKYLFVICMYLVEHKNLDLAELVYLKNDKILHFWYIKTWKLMNVMKTGFLNRNLDLQILYIFCFNYK